jgi:hypothetical protein
MVAIGITDEIPRWLPIDRRHGVEVVLGGYCRQSTKHIAPIREVIDAVAPSG